MSRRTELRAKRHAAEANESPATWKDGRTPGRRCTARSTRTGNPCQQAPVTGTNVCWHHGGAAPQIKAAAQRRLLMASDPAAAELVKIAMDRKRDDRVRLGAINSLLDRAGIIAKQSVAVELAPWQGMVDNIITEVDDVQISRATEVLLQDNDEAEPEQRHAQRRQERTGLGSTTLSPNARRGQS